MMPLAVAAAAYAARGWPIHPVRPRDKASLIAGGWHTASAEAEQVASWWRQWPLANIGLVPRHAGLVVLDLDGPAGDAAAAAFGLLAEPTLTVTTGRGRHLYFRHPGGHIGNRSLMPQLDVRADGGYILLPPSVHPAGATYRWAGTLADVRELPPRALAALRPAPAPETPPPPTNGAAFVAPPRSAGEIRARIAAYLGKVGPCAEGSRNNTAYGVAAWLVRDLALAPADAEPWLTAWNDANDPPLPARELAAVLASAVKTGRHPIGAGLGVRAAATTGAPASALERVAQAAARITRRRAAA